MFGFRGGELPETVVRKKGYRQEAKEQWGFLTQYDLSTVKNEAQLSAMIQERSGLSEAQAKRDVHAWAQGKQF